MSTLELGMAILWGVILTIIVIAVFALTLSGRDLEIFDAYKTTAPRHYHRLRTVCRFNGPLVALMSLVGIIATPLIAVSPDGGILMAMGTFSGSSMFLWLIVRWFLWGVRSQSESAKR